MEYHYSYELCSTEHAEAVLNNGKVLITGGVGLSSAELYDQSIEVWDAIGNMSNSRYGHTTTVLTSGNVLVVGTSASKSTELYLP